MAINNPISKMDFKHFKPIPDIGNDAFYNSYSISRDTA